MRNRNRLCKNLTVEPVNMRRKPQVYTQLALGMFKCKIAALQLDI